MANGDSIVPLAVCLLNSRPDTQRYLTTTSIARSARERSSNKKINLMAESAKECVWETAVYGSHNRDTSCGTWFHVVGKNLSEQGDTYCPKCCRKIVEKEEDYHA